MKNHQVTHVGAFVSAFTFLAIGCSAPASEDDPSFDEVGAALSSMCAPAVDPSIAVPTGNKAAFALDATGSQVYVCQASGAGYAWTLQAPDALLYNNHGKEVGTHYAGPTWEYKDGSLVVAAKVAAFTPDPTAVPWLLLQATSHTGKGQMDDVTYVQRLYTVGGLAPDAASCTAEDVGDLSPIEYVATYYYFVPGKPPCGCK
jgi:hypothetical protein